MSRYHIIKDYVGNYIDDDKLAKLEGELVTSHPYWILAIIRLNAPATYDRSKKASFTKNAQKGVVTRGETLIVTSDCISLSVQGDKSNHMKTLQATLIQNELNYMYEIAPGDWVFCWMLADSDKAPELIARIKKNLAANKFDDGLKFVGRVQSIRKSLNVNQIGTKTVSYNLQGVAFRELDSSVFYDPRLSSNETSLNQFMGKLNLAIEKLLEDTKKGAEGGISINKALPVFFNLLLGDGLPENLSTEKVPDEVRQVTGLTKSKGNAPFAFLIPAQVGNLLGKKTRGDSLTGGVLAFADIAEMQYGVQKYASRKGSVNTYKIFIPDGISDSITGFNKFTSKKLSGIFLPVPPDFNNRTVWTILNQWLNPAMNEMYTAMKVNNEGNIVPTIVVRQLPFSSRALGSKAGVAEVKFEDPPAPQKFEYGYGSPPPKIKQEKPSKKSKKKKGQELKQTKAAAPVEKDKYPVVTEYYELPRWIAHGNMITQADIGRSDSLRFNFVHVYGRANTQGDQAAYTTQLVRFKPIRDDVDIARNGLRPYMNMIDCAAAEAAKGGPLVWMELLSDIIMGGHMAYTGTVSMLGIQSPICEGDNFEWDGIVYHIEAVTHTCSIAPDGFRTFNTTLTLSHGLKSDADEDPSRGPLYPGTAVDDNTFYDPGFTDEGDHNILTSEDVASTHRLDIKKPSSSSSVHTPSDPEGETRG